MKKPRLAAALTAAAMSLLGAGAHAFGESDAKALCKQYVKARVQKNDQVEWVGEPRWQTMDTATERRWSVFMDFRTINGSQAPKPKKAICQGRFDRVSNTWKVEEYNER